jgi:hypothetical protein
LGASRCRLRFPDIKQKQLGECSKVLVKMAFFKRFLTPTAQANSPNLYENDHVYPVHTLDDTPTMRSILITWTICFNDVLDADKLQQSLSSLLNIGDWRKLGGRLRLKVNQSAIPFTFHAY